MWSKSDIILLVISFAIASSFFLLDSLPISWRLAVVFGSFSLMSIAIFGLQRRIEARRGQDTGVARDMTEAFNRLFDSRAPAVTRLRIFSYIGNIADRELMSHHRDLKTDIEVRLIIRDPDPTVPWRFPNSERTETRKREIISNIESLQGHHVFDSTFRHRLRKEPLSAFVRFHNVEPSMFFIIADKQGDSREGFVGFYHLQERPGGLDFSGSDRAVVSITRPDILDDLASWFEYYWENLARQPTAIPEVRA